MNRASLTLLLPLAALGVAGGAQAQVFGSLANFDAVNDTGSVAHGFEIRIEDASFSHSSIYSVFGLDRNFGVPPTSVERYGAPVITDLVGGGVSVRYAATFAAGAWSTGTPFGPYANAGDSCWPLGNPLYAGGGLSCDHFGIATYGNPAKVSYSWLVDPGNSGTLSAVQVAIPAVNFVYAPPPPAGPVPAVRPVVAEIEAHKADNEVFGTALWVKTYSKHLDHNVKLEDLMHGNADVPGNAEVEVEFEIFQAGDLGGNGKKQLNLNLAAGDAGLVLRYEFYKYLGDLGANGEALCGRQGHGHGGNGGGGANPLDCGGLGDFVGAQMAGFNAIQAPLAAAVPEPQSSAMLLAGLGVVGWLMRKSRRASRSGCGAVSNC